MNVSTGSKIFECFLLHFFLCVSCIILKMKSRLIGVYVCGMMTSRVMCRAAVAGQTAVGGACG